ncbi:MAG: hypothetical protein MJK08_13850 [Campylobacterales bacterium]|nr:hypothetical protein [Campylobacterales bacterium]
MFQKINYINIFLFSFILLFNIYNKSFDKISSKIYNILPNSQNKELLKEFEKFDNNKRVFLFYKGLDTNSLEKIKNLEKKLILIKGLKLLKYKKNIKLNKHLNKYLLYSKELNYDLVKNINIEKKLFLAKEKMINESYSFTFNKNDPLELFSTKIKKIESKNKHLILGNVGYLSIFTIDNKINNIKEYKIIHDKIYESIDKNSKVFSPIFYYVQNSQIIKNDANKIIILASIFLIFLYIILLRDIKLLINTIITLASSILLSILFCTWYFSQISIFVFVFGIAISTVAIDYMFHHYFNNYYEYKKPFNKDVFLGLITTVITFFIISFVSFDLIKQICYFAIISLVFSYIQFTFLFPLIKFETPVKKESKVRNNLFNIKSKYITIISILIIIFTLPNLNFDLDLKNLDVKNKKLIKVEDFFTSKLDNTKNINILIKADSINELIESANYLKKEFPKSIIPISKLISKKEFTAIKKQLKRIDFENINKELDSEAKNLGFRKDIFKNTYNLNSININYTLKQLKDFSIEIIKYNNYYFAYARINKVHLQKLKEYKFVQILSIKIMFKKQLKKIYKELVQLGSLSILFILIMLIFISKKNFLTALNFLIFPLACILFLSNFIIFNILHLFILFIILAIGIDFGIYISSDNVNSNTKKAIFYSLLSTFAGFGVLIFSNINALFSIGLIACIGITASVILLLISKRIIK